MVNDILKFPTRPFIALQLFIAQTHMIMRPNNPDTFRIVCNQLIKLRDGCLPMPLSKMAYRSVIHGMIYHIPIRESLDDLLIIEPGIWVIAILKRGHASFKQLNRVVRVGVTS